MVNDIRMITNTFIKLHTSHVSLDYALEFWLDRETLRPAQVEEEEEEELSQ